MHACVRACMCVCPEQILSLDEVLGVFVQLEHASVRFQLQHIFTLSPIEVHGLHGVLQGALPSRSYILFFYSLFFPRDILKKAFLTQDSFSLTNIISQYTWTKQLDMSLDSIFFYPFG